MELTDTELELIARSRVSKPYKRRIYIASAIAVITIIGAGSPGGTHIWQMITVPSVAAAYFIFVMWQGKSLEQAATKTYQELQSEIGEQKA